MSAKVHEKAPAKQIQTSASVNTQFLQILSTKNLEVIAGGPGDEMCPYCLLSQNYSKSNEPKLSKATSTAY